MHAYAYFEYRFITTLRMKGRDSADFGLHWRPVFLPHAVGNPTYFTCYVYYAHHFPRATQIPSWIYANWYCLHVRNRTYNSSYSTSRTQRLSRKHKTSESQPSASWWQCHQDGFRGLVCQKWVSFIVLLLQLGSVGFSRVKLGLGLAGSCQRMRTTRTTVITQPPADQTPGWMIIRLPPTLAWPYHAQPDTWLSASALRFRHGGR